MINKVRYALERWNMLDGCNCIAVGLSGGADSISLLHVLNSLSSEYNFSLRAVHVHHGIRGTEADEDEAFCRNFCSRLNIPLDVFCFDVPSIAKEQGIGLEECGRKCRYQCFEEVHEKWNCAVATAHTLSDSAETVIMNMIRGCGIAGMRGIPPKRGYIIRPIIGVEREEVERYCLENDLQYVTDVTNSDIKYTRNRIRSKIIPQLKEINPGFLQSVARLTKAASEDEKYLEFLVEDALKKAGIGEKIWQVKILNTLPDALKNRAIYAIICKITGKSPDFTHIELIKNLISQKSGAVSLFERRNLCVKNGLLFEAENNTECVEWSCNAELCTVLPDGRKIIIEPVGYDIFVKRAKKDVSLFKCAVNCDIIKCNAIIRNRRDGDYFYPNGRGVGKKLKKLFNEAKIPVLDREKLAIAEIEGKIIWVEGFGPAEGFAPTEDTQNVYLIKFEHV